MPFPTPISSLSRVAISPRIAARGGVSHCLAFSLLLMLAVTDAAAREWHVSPAGDDQAPGSEAQPLRTVARLVASMSPGDTGILHAGVYREEVAVTKPNLTLRSARGAHVELTGCDLVRPESWTDAVVPTSGVAVRAASVPSRVYQVFHDGRRQSLARWPDKTAPMLSLKDWEETHADKATSKVKIATLPTGPANAWRDGYYLGIHADKKPMASWYTVSGRIRGSAGREIQVEQWSRGFGVIWCHGDGFGYIVDSLHALDQPGEWCWRAGRLHYLFPGSAVGGEVEAQTRLYILRTTAPGLVLRDLHFRAGAVLLGGEGGEVSGCSFVHPSPFLHVFGDDGFRSQWGTWEDGTAGVAVTGNGYVVRDCYIGRSWWAGITLAGNRNLLENCLVEECNWMGRRPGAVEAYGDDNTVRRCTIRRTGASAIEGGNTGAPKRWEKLKYARRALWEHNLCEDGGDLGVDQGFFYVNHQRGDRPPADSVWRYNILRGYHGPDRGTWAETRIGLYVDNNSSGYRVHHNLVIDCRQGIHYNDFLEGEQAGRDVYFCNNTFWRVGAVFAMGLRNQAAPEEPALMDAGIIFRNNLALDCGGIGALEGRAPIGDNNYTNMNTKAHARNAEAGDFTLPPKSRFIDAGALIPGITDGFKGKRPDIGAFEAGGPAWTAGATTVRPASLAKDPWAP